jgi:putative addiction module component (TIGR02574 family)
MNDAEGRRRSATMNVRLRELEEKALQLTATERSELIGALIASLEGEAQGSLEEIRDGWDAEIERRIAEMEAGRTRFVDAAEALRTLRAHAEQRRSR